MKKMTYMFRNLKIRAAILALLLMGFLISSYTANAQFYIVSDVAPGAFYYHDIATSTWVAKAVPPSTSLNLVSDGTKIFGLKYAFNAPMRIYDIATDVWTSGATPPTNSNDQTSMVHLNGKIYVMSYVTNATLYEYDIATDVWTTKAAIAGEVNTRSLASDGTNLYTVDYTSKKIYKYTVSTNAWALLAGVAPASMHSLQFNGGFLYGMDVNYKVAKYNLSTNTWTEPATSDFSAIATHPKGSTSGGGGVYMLADAGTGTALYSYNFVSDSWTTKALTGIAGNGANYFVYAGAAGPQADLSVTVSPATQTGNKGEIRTYTVTITNAGPDVADNVSVCVNIPGNGTLLVASPSQGTYTESNKTWDVGTMAVGSKTLTISVKVN